MLTAREMKQLRNAILASQERFVINGQRFVNLNNVLVLIAGYCENPTLDKPRTKETEEFVASG